MKNIILAASAVILIATPGLSLAQDDHHHEGGGHPGGGGAPQYHPPSTPPSRPAGPAQAAPQYRGAPQGGQPGYHPPSGQPGAQGGYRPNGPTFPGGQGGYRPQPGQMGYQGGYHDGHGPTPGNNLGYRAGQAPRAGGQAFGYSGRQYFRYRASPYQFPNGYYGWTNHSWRRGEWLPQVFINQGYYINDWYDFGLWQPNYGYEWIRVGADAVLVNLADGQVVDVVPGVYYY